MIYITYSVSWVVENASPRDARRWFDSLMGLYLVGAVDFKVRSNGADFDVLPMIWTIRRILGDPFVSFPCIRTVEK